MAPRWGIPPVPGGADPDPWVSSPWLGTLVSLVMRGMSLLMRRRMVLPTAPSGNCRMQESECRIPKSKC